MFWQWNLPKLADSLSKIFDLKKVKNRWAGAGATATAASYVVMHSWNKNSPPGGISFWPGFFFSAFAGSSSFPKGKRRRKNLEITQYFLPKLQSAVAIVGKNNLSVAETWSVGPNTNLSWPNKSQ